MTLVLGNIKFAIILVSFFKYFKSNSLFCSDYHSLYFTFAAFHSGNNKGQSL